MLPSNADQECVKDAPESLASGFWTFVAWLGMPRRFWACGAFGELAWMRGKLAGSCAQCAHGLLFSGT